MTNGLCIFGHFFGKIVLFRNRKGPVRHLEDSLSPSAPITCYHETIQDLPHYHSRLLENLHFAPIGSICLIRHLWLGLCINIATYGSMLADGQSFFGWCMRLSWTSGKIKETIAIFSAQ